MPNRILHQWKPLAMNIRKEESLLYEEKEAVSRNRRVVGELREFVEIAFCSRSRSNVHTL